MKHINTVSNLATSVTAWMTTSIILGIALLFVTYRLTVVAVNAPSYLVPYGFAITDKKVKVKPSEFADPEYASAIAIGDLKLFTDWTPSTVFKKYERFLRRTTPELYTAKSVELLKEAKRYAKDGTTQMFFVDKTALEDGKVLVTGDLMQYEGSRRTINKKVTYAIKYTLNGGIPYVQEIYIVK